jgi:hypothetical protein
MDGSETTSKIAPVSGVDLSGTWHFADLRLTYANGRTSRPWASSASGALIYAPDGHMSLTLNYPGRGGRIECRSICGQYQIVDGKLLHYVIVSGDIREVGTVQEHEIVLAGPRLTMTVRPAPAGGPGSRLDYDWNRAEPRATVGATFLRANAARGFNRAR